MDASLTSPRIEKDATGAPEKATASDGTGEQSKALGSRQTDTDVSLEEKQKANESNFLARVKDAGTQDGSMLVKNFKRRLLQKEGLWWKDTAAENMALYIPKTAGNALRNECIAWVHVHPFTGHVGIHRTSEILHRDFWWPRMEQDIVEYVGDCEMCSRNKPTNQKKAGS